MSFIRDNVVEILTEEGFGETTIPWEIDEFEYWVDDGIVCRSDGSIVKNYKDYIHSAIQLSGFDDPYSEANKLYVRNNELKISYEIFKFHGDFARRKELISR